MAGTASWRLCSAAASPPSRCGCLRRRRGAVGRVYPYLAVVAATTVRRWIFCPPAPPSWRRALQRCCGACEVCSGAGRRGGVGGGRVAEVSAQGVRWWLVGSGVAPPSRRWEETDLDWRSTGASPAGEPQRRRFLWATVEVYKAFDAKMLLRSFGVEVSRSSFRRCSGVVREKEWVFRCCCAEDPRGLVVFFVCSGTFLLMCRDSCPLLRFSRCFACVGCVLMFLVE